MASWEATGPPVMVWWTPAKVVASVPEERFCTAPSASSRMVADDRERQQDAQQLRTRSTQKLPIRSVRLRVKPRISATATAMPTAAETKFCTASPDIWTRWPIVDSPE